MTCLHRPLCVGDRVGGRATFPVATHTRPAYRMMCSIRGSIHRQKQPTARFKGTQAIKICSFVWIRLLRGRQSGKAAPETSVVVLHIFSAIRFRRPTSTFCEPNQLSSWSSPTSTGNAMKRGSLPVGQQFHVPGQRAVRHSAPHLGSICCMTDQQ